MKIAVERFFFAAAVATATTRGVAAAIALAASESPRDEAGVQLSARGTGTEGVPEPADRPGRHDLKWLLGSLVLLIGMYVLYRHIGRASNGVRITVGGIFVALGGLATSREGPEGAARGLVGTAAFLVAFMVGTVPVIVWTGAAEKHQIHFLLVAVGIATVLWLLLVWQLELYERSRAPAWFPKRLQSTFEYVDQRVADHPPRLSLKAWYEARTEMLASWASVVAAILLVSGTIVTIAPSRGTNMTCITTGKSVSVHIAKERQTKYAFTCSA